VTAALAADKFHCRITFEKSCIRGVTEIENEGSGRGVITVDNLNLFNLKETQRNCWC
jgi:hypothetical protein